MEEMSNRILQEIKDKLDIVDFIGSYIELKKVGSYYRGLCPFHQERNPSFFVSPERGIFKCFGCGAVGDIVTFYMKIENLDFKQAIKQLAEKLGIEISPLSIEEKEIKEIKRLLEINKIALNYYKKNLKEIKEVKDYLLKRGLKEESIDYFDLGYAKEGSHLRDYCFNLGYSLEDLEKVGLINEKKEDKFQSRIIFPLIDPSAKILGFTGRIFPEKEKAPKYLNTPDTLLFKKSKFIYGLVYTKEYIQKERKAILVEGQFDFILSFQNNLKNIAAISGSALTKDHLNLLKKYTNRLVFAFDNDEAGFKASLKAGILALSTGCEIYKLIFGDYKDLAEFFENKNSLERLKEINFLDYLIEYVQNNYNLNELDNKRFVLNLILPFLKYLDSITTSFYLSKLAGVLSIREDFLLSELNKLQPTIIEDLEEKTLEISPERIYDLIEKFIALSLLTERRDEIEILKNELEKDFVDYIDSLLSNEERQEIINLRMLYEQINHKDLAREISIIKKEILKEYYKEKINSFNRIVGNLRTENLEPFLKEVKFYIEKLKSLEKNA